MILVGLRVMSLMFSLLEISRCIPRTQVVSSWWVHFEILWASDTGLADFGITEIQIICKFNSSMDKFAHGRVKIADNWYFRDSKTWESCIRYQYTYSNKTIILGMNYIKFELKCSNFISRKHTWKCSLQIVCHFIQTLKASRFRNRIKRNSISHKICTVFLCFSLLWLYFVICNGIMR